jgi:hypothetical protein
MSDNLYRHHQSVPDRVDAAWLKGYEAGKADVRKLAGLAIVVGAFVALRRSRIHWAACLAIALAVALYVIPVLLIAMVVRVGCRGARAYHRRRVGRRIAQPSVTLDDESTF